MFTDEELQKSPISPTLKRSFLSKNLVYLFRKFHGHKSLQLFDMHETKVRNDLGCFLVINTNKGRRNHVYGLYFMDKLEFDGKSDEGLNFMLEMAESTDVFLLPQP